MNNLLFGRIHNGLHNVLDLRQKQNALTSGNIANVDTPGYKAKFVRFDELLTQAMGMEDVPMMRTHPGHFAGAAGTIDNPDVEEIDAPSWAKDGNSVQLERELVRLKTNALQFSGVTRGLSKRLAMLRFAASNGK